MQKVNTNDIAGNAKILFKSDKQIASMMFAHMTVVPDQRVPTEGVSQHTQDEYMCAVEGEMAFSVNGEEFILHAGEALFIPRGEPHWSLNHTDKPFVFVGLLAE